MRLPAPLLTPLRAGLLLAGALTLAPAPAAALPEAQEAEIRALVRDYLINDPTVLEEALDALEARKAAQMRAKIEKDPRSFAIGPADAPVTVVEFFDYRCGYCKASMAWVMDKVRTRKDIRFVFKEFPILSEASAEASRAALASLKQGKYLPFHQALMTSRGELSSPEIDQLARKVGLDVARLRRDMRDPAINALIEQNHAQAAASKVTGTPAFMINGTFVHGFDAEALDKALREATRAAAGKARAGAK